MKTLRAKPLWIAALALMALGAGGQESDELQTESASSATAGRTETLATAPDSAESATQAAAPTEMETPPPPFSEGLFPCSACHGALPANPTRRVLTEAHTNIVFEHDAHNRWCLDCHATDDRDQLHLAGGTQIEFAQSYRLCGQCHGPTLRDWKAGVHGKRTGAWNGHKRYLLCAHCHDPHAPKIKPLAPFPAPQPPEGRPFILGGAHQQAQPAAEEDQP